MEEEIDQTAGSIDIGGTQVSLRLLADWAVLPDAWMDWRTFQTLVTAGSAESKSTLFSE